MPFSILVMISITSIFFFMVVEGLSEETRVFIFINDLKKIIDTFDVWLGLVYEKEQLKVLLDSELTGSCCCGSTALPKKDLNRIVDDLAGKVASIRVIGHKE